MGSPDRLGLTLARGLDKSTKASQLIAQGRTDKASAGQFGYPPLLSFKQSLERKLTRSYTLHNGRPCSLLLYYDRQTAVEPYDLLFDCTEVLTTLLTDAVFDVVWLYDHSFSSSSSISVSFGAPEFEATMAGQPVPLSHWSTPGRVGAVVGRVALQEGRLAMSFDAHYSMTFNAMVASISKRQAKCRSIHIR